MKFLTYLALACMLFTLAGCPKKAADGEEKAEPVEGSSSAGDKSGEGSSDEMQEKKGSSAEPAADPAAAPADDKK